MPPVYADRPSLKEMPTVEWLTRMNLAIAHIEKHLDGSVVIAEVAGVAGCSVYHFQRMFFSVVGVTPAEYIRRRQLTLAGADLAAGDLRVLDVALKYGYESPNAFTRAFKKMHGVNPGQVRGSGVKLTAYERVVLCVEVKGGSGMNYRIVDKPAFELVAESKDFTNDNFFQEAPAFWKKYVGTDAYQKLWGVTGGRWGSVSDAPLMSVYLPDEKGDCDSFTDAMGVEKPEGSSAAGFDVFEIPAATYAEFWCGYRQAAKMNKYIYGEWFPSTGFERDAGKPDIAAYFPVAFLPVLGMRVRWWIPVVKKD